MMDDKLQHLDEANMTAKMNLNTVMVDSCTAKSNRERSNQLESRANSEEDTQQLLCAEFRAGRPRTQDPRAARRRRSQMCDHAPIKIVHRHLT
ncbi:hypothetical protein FVE85_6047 [Porphyridium purpureum]|uniref:Uncharacterized protein n=1 Tax=Porphyridium purpureum TaxID=35688 RepID=A0A5J4Z5U5_PORPP|nr:hypothetical protein FVE85_6047 [Porphyridium purpureum]|eukprot:POR3547..scf295_1